MKFHRAYIEITNICGLACTFCPPKVTPTATMPLPLFEKTMDQLKPYTREVALHVMGDPLTLSNLYVYLDIAHAKGFRVMLTSSGFLIPKHTASTLFHPAIRQLNISLNSYNKNTTDLTPEEYFDPIIALCRRKVSENRELFINLRLWNLSGDDGEADYNREVFKRLDAAFGTDLTHAAPEKSIRLDSKVLLHFDRYFRWPNLKNEWVGDGYCHGLISQVGVLANGDVVPCCLDGEGVMRLGNLADSPLSTILVSPRATAIIEGFKASKAVEPLCQHCSYKSRFSD